MDQTNINQSISRANQRASQHPYQGSNELFSQRDAGNISGGMKRFLPLLSLLLCFFITIPVHAETKQELELAVLYEQAFGKKANTVTQTVAIATPSSQKADMSVLYAQAFGQQKKSNSKKPTRPTAKADDLSALYAKAFGKKPRPAPSQVDVELRVNTVEQGEVTVYADKQGKIATVDKNKLMLILQDVIKEHIYKRIQEKVKNTERVTFQTLTSLGMKSIYNSVNLSLDLQINASLRKPRILSMQKKRKISVRDENKITASEISAFMNLYSNLEATSTKNDNEFDVNMRLETSFSVGEVVFENTTDYKDKKLNPIKTTITYDQPDKLKRFRVGTISTGNHNFQENLQLNGIRLSKEFFMNPEIQIRPKGNETFLLETDSEVEVYINQQLHQRFYLDEGVYSLQDIGLYEGANNIRIRIKDKFGKITEKNSQQFYDSHLLKPELSLYAISVGVLSNKEAYRNNELLNQPLFSGYYQRGITSNLTLGLDAQFSPDSYLLGAEAIATVPQGSLKHSFSVSGGKEKDSGYATRFEFKPNIKRQLIGLDTLREDTLEMDKTIGRFLLGWSISGEYRSPEFAMLNEVIELNEKNKQLKASLKTHFSLDLGDKWRGNLNLGVSDFYYDDKSMTAAVTATKTFNNGIRWSVGAHYDNQDDFSVNLQVSIPLSRDNYKRRKQLDIAVNTKDNSYQSRLNIDSLSLLGRNSLSGSLEHRKDANTSQQQLDLNYKETFYSANLKARNRKNKNGSSNQQFNLGLNTALACIGQNCAVSNPINDSFAIVSGPSNQDAAIAINNGNSNFTYSNESDGSLPDNYSALIKERGSKAVVPIDSYRYQKISIDESTLPNGYDPEKTEFEVFPRYHQGFVIQAGGEPATIVDGTLVDSSKKILSYKGGQWIPQGRNGKTIAFFSNKVGRFRMPSVPAGKYKLELFDYPDMQTVFINVPDKKGMAHDLGNIIMRPQHNSYDE